MTEFLNQTGDFLLIFITFIISTIYAGKAMRRCTEIGLKAQVNQRSSHKTPTPTGGGYSFVVVITLFGLIWNNTLANTEHQLTLNILLIIAAGIAYLGWVDDTKELKPLLRLSMHILACAIGAFALPTVAEHIMPLWAEKTLIILAWVWFLNLYNFMDGIDGIAATQAAFIALFLSFTFLDIKAICLVIVACMFGFLRFNWHPARVFMGDVGSTYLGYLLAGLLFLSLSNNFEQGFWSALIITAVFVGDATFTLIKRLLKGKKPWQAHKEHFYQRANQLGLNHAQVVKRICIINAVLFIMAITASISHIGLQIFLTSIALLSFVALRIRLKEKK